MLRGTPFSSTFNRTCPIFSFFNKVPLLSTFQYKCCRSYHQLVRSNTSFISKPVKRIQACNFAAVSRAHLCILAMSATSKIRESSEPAKTKVSHKKMRKAWRESPEGVLTIKLNGCSKKGDLAEALRLYDEARSNNVKLDQQHYNSVLYLCSSVSPVEFDGDGVTGSAYFSSKRGFDIFQQMIIDKVAPNEATFTNVARLALVVDDPEMAFDLIKQMINFKILPRLRSYGPALFGFCKRGMPDRAYEVDAHMAEFGVMPEEAELCALLKVSADVNRADKVYETLHRLRAIVRQVTDSTFGVIEDWFRSGNASKIGVESWDVSKVSEGMAKGGGGWHGQGWLGIGQWRVIKTQVDEKGVCQSCNEKLVCIDIDPKETENFASSLANLACQREAKADFVRFQEWLRQHGPFDAIIDGANVGLINQKTFSFSQLKFVVGKLHQMSPSKKLPLVILHQSRITGGPAQHPNNKKLIDFWKKSGALYATPAGSNDDWYWLYAAVSCKCLLVTNDEMRDHLFQLLGTSFFPRWKEKHQARLSVSRSGIALFMPPPYSIVIQESETGSWHIPTATGDDFEAPRRWLCATRPTNKTKSTLTRE